MFLITSPMSFLLPTVLSCLIVGVADGDTLTARCDTPHLEHPYQQERVRLTGIDAPERGQAFARRSRQSLSELAHGRQARLECGKRDRYQRLVCDVYVTPSSAVHGPKTLDVGLAQVEQGLAWWYRAYSREQTPIQRLRYERAEARARGQGLGLWHDANPIPPWDYRRRSRSRQR